MKRNIFCFLLFCFIHISSAQLPAGFIRERIATGLNPTSMTLAPDGRIFITEKNGRILIVRDDQLLDEPLMTLNVDDTNERGLGHVVLHPDFEINGYFYIFYSLPGFKANRISRWTANGDHIVPGSELTIIDLDETGGDYHNGGSMVFGFDGYLYVGTGDGGQNWRGEDLGSTNGKILRLDEYGQPVQDNPWYDFHYLRANTVYAYGFRNPFTMTMNPLTGEIYVNDVGFASYEEVNLLEKGAFYGWPRVEGKEMGQELPTEYRDPIFQYAHQSDYCAIVGSAFYYPEVIQFPQSYVGVYFYSDYCTGRIRKLDVETGKDLGVFISDGDRVVDMLVSPEGSFYYLERSGIGDGSQEDNTTTNEGILWKVSYTGSGKPFISLQPASVLASAGEDALFKVNVLGEIPFSYTWYVNDSEMAGNDSPYYTIQNTSLEEDSTSVFVVVRNAHGQATSDTALLRVTNNQRPEPLILLPAVGSTYKAGDHIIFSGQGLDAEDGIMAESALSWRIDFQHGIHAHPGMPWTSGISGGEWLIPSIGETSADVFYRVYLNVSDNDGLSSVIYRDIFPQLGIIHVNSVPSELVINLDGAPVKTPYLFEGVEGISRFLTAPLKQTRNDSIYFFDQWIDGFHEANREIKATPENQVFEGRFRAIKKGKGYGLTAAYYDNVEFNGTPVLTKIDSVINHQFFLQSPHPSMPEDHFGIQWTGYIQAYNSGNYKFSVIVDDGIYLEIDHEVVIDKWEDGVHYESEYKYLESGHLYPFKLKMFDGLYNAQVKLKWSSPEFNEEIIPSSQLYPVDYLTRANTFGVVSIVSIATNTLDVFTESYKETTMDFTIVSATGQSFIFLNQEIPLGKNVVTVDISQLLPGIYFLTGIDRISGKKTVERFIKVL